MPRIAVIGAALALLMSSAAYAQTDSPAPGETAPPPAMDEPPASDAAPADQPDTGAGPMAEEDGARDRGARDRRGWRDRRGAGERHGRRHRHDERHAMHGFAGGPASEGAFFRFRGADGQVIAIKCADRDTTQQCVEAVMPMLERLLPGQGPADRN